MISYLIGRNEPILAAIGLLIAFAGTIVFTAIFCDRLPKDGGIQRYKGLGEMNDHELWETTMDPTTRILKQVTLDEAADADETFAILMGDDVEQRRSFIQRNASDVRFLDI